MASRIFSNLKVLDLISVETILVGFSLGARGLALSNDINDITAGSLLRTLAPQGPALFACCSVLISISCLIILFHSQTFLCPGLAGLEDPVCVWGFVKNQIYSTKKRTIEFFLALDYHLMISSHSSDIFWPFHNEVINTRHAKIVDTALIFGVEGVSMPQSWKRLIRTNNDVQTQCLDDAQTSMTWLRSDLFGPVSTNVNSCTSPPWHDMLHWSLVLTVCSHLHVAEDLLRAGGNHRRRHKLNSLVTLMRRQASSFISGRYRPSRRCVHPCTSLKGLQYWLFCSLVQLHILRVLSRFCIVLRLRLLLCWASWRHAAKQQSTKTPAKFYHLFFDFLFHHLSSFISVSPLCVTLSLCPRGKPNSFLVRFLHCSQFVRVHMTRVRPAGSSFGMCWTRKFQNGMGANKSKQNKQEFLGFFSCKGLQNGRWS